MTESLAYYRLPGQKLYYRIKSKRGALPAAGTTDNDAGFLISPFDSGTGNPVMFIPADEIFSDNVPAKSAGTVQCEPENGEEIEDEYRRDFIKFHDAVCGGRFQKLVLSRSRSIGLNGEADPEDMFFRACRTYPDFMVMMFCTPTSGIWLSATPEPLLEYSDGVFHSVALAGTMPLDCRDGWSGKNRLEQNIVERFITDAVKGIAEDIEINGPYDSPAGELKHLKTDITFRAGGGNFSALAGKLHPTPASCGLPQAEAKSFILENESHPRKYYSGYAGPVNIDGQSRLYVLLRCLELAGDRRSLTLYAGGGILQGSVCGSEYDETVQKMRTVAKCIAIKKI